MYYETVDTRTLQDRIDEIYTMSSRNRSDDEWKELRQLTNARDEIGDNWKWGETLIRADYFTEYVKDMIADIGDMPRDIPWYIEDAIDWDRVADNVRSDYEEVVIGDETYWYRYN